MPSLPDIPGKDLVTGTGRRAGKVAIGAGVAVIAIGGYLIRRLVSRSKGVAEEAEPISPDPIAKPPTPPAVAEQSGGRVETTATEGSTPAAPTPAAPPKPTAEPGDISNDKDPHHALNNPVGEPDPTEWPDPYEKREDPRDPGDPNDPLTGAEPHPATGAESTSEPHPSEDPEAGDRAKPPQRDKLDD